MKKISLLLLVLLYQTYSFGQQYELRGKVTNQNKQTLEFVISSLLGNQKKLIAQTSTDSLGTFSIKAEKGNYRLILEQFGTEYLNKEITINQNIDLGTIEIKESVQLDGVTLKSRKKLVEQKVDRLVFNVENSVTATGGTALDALKATPTVRVQNEVISIVGKGEILVMIDDRLQRMPQEDLAAFLKSIPSDNIKSIEVITTPPAKYDAEGNSGLINIKLKTAKANSWNANIGTSYTQKTYAGGNINGLFTYNRDNLSVESSISKGKQTYLTSSESNIFYKDETWKQDVKNKSNADVLSVGLGVDYKLTNKWSAGIKYLGSFTDKTASNNPFTTRYNNDNAMADSYIASNVTADNNPKMNAVNLHNSFVLDTLGKNISVDMDYFDYNKNDYRFFSGNEFDSNKNSIINSFFSATNSNRNKIKNYSANIDISLPYDWANITFGAKAFHNNTDNNLVVYDNETGIPVFNTNQSNVFNYKEYNQALYFSGSKKINTKWETQIGLRIEATQTKGYSENLNQTNKNNYMKLFPTAYVTYTANENNSLSLNYSRRIRRPDFDYLNPFVIKTSPYYYSEGNPYLKPSLIDNFEFSFIRNQKWVNSVYFSQVSDFGQELSIIDPNTNITRNTPLNYANTYQIGLSTSYNFNKWSWWNSFTGFNLNYQNVKSKTDFIASIDGYNGYIYSNNDFTINNSKTLFIGLNYGLQLPGRYQIFNISTLNILDISVKLLTVNKNLSITILGEDLLNAQKPLIDYTSNGIKTNVKSYNDTRGFRISLSYKFGNQNMKSKERNFGNDDERNRLN
ncbi:TonB-dependent receptor [Flavobacterium aquidurense]|uniref:outer membrane beta-barrel family protein n=1 Tax=Flavobacterium aquidurense TaxID=362413 RepID=UPI00090EC065|nr:outer membrane beta-barrel family protein [Flavobacterium aquidurense]OXA72978.1 TonB-dependent receptor [Flavobacterium aquidurense]SHH15685.1 Outer membrane receptor proteins, mostly Fe transport [Flavobacterium frigidimaris]